MKHDLPTLDAFKVFEAAGRLLSFSLAADELCISKGAVSYQVRKLEQALDRALFRRGTRQVYLTDAGQALLQTTQRVFGELTTAIQSIRPADERHDVVIGATTYVAMRWLSSRIAEFGEQHPQVSILLQHAVNAEDFALHSVDFAIRWRPLTAGIRRRSQLILPMPLFPVCSPHLLRKLIVGAAPLPRRALAEVPLESVPLLCEDRRLDLWRAWCGNLPMPLDNPRRVIADANVRTQAAIDGQGWTLADDLMSNELQGGLLVAPFEDRLEGYGYALETAPGRFLGRDARLLLDWLVARER